MGDMGRMPGMGGMGSMPGNPGTGVGAVSDLLGGDGGDVTYPYYLINGRIPAAAKTFTAAPGQRSRIVEIHSAEPIHVSYSDRDDNEITWHYGDNMPLAIVKALDRFDGIITRQIREEAEEIQ